MERPKGLMVVFLNMILPIRPSIPVAPSMVLMEKLQLEHLLSVMENCTALQVAVEPAIWEP